MNSTGERGAWWRCTTVWLASTAVAGGLIWWLLPELSAAPGVLTGDPSVAFETMLVSLAAVAATCCILWLWLVTTLTTAAAATGRVRSRLHGCPEAWRRLVLTACGVALASGLLVPTHAAAALPVLITDPVTPGRGDPGRGAALVEGLPLPDRPTTRPASAVRRVGPTPPRGSLVVVSAGDSLWAIAADHLPVGATDRRVAAEWRRLYAANHDVVGDDPDLIRPGQQLRVPPTAGDR